MTRRRRRVGLGGRLFAAQTLVVLVGASTAGLVAVAVGPTIFRDHLHHAGTISAEASRHVEEAYASASAVSLGVAMLCALAAALAVSAYVARRVARPIGELARVAAEVTDGRYEVRAPAPGIGAEFDTVAVAFNIMAGRLGDVEGTRRRLLGDLGHELRTPIATIEAYLEAAEDGVGVDDEDTLTVLRTQTARLRRLAEDLTAVARAEEARLDLDRRPTAVVDLVDAAVAAARPGCTARGVTLTHRIAAGLPTVDADPQRLGQVLGNLLDNALRHTPPGGAVTVTADRHDGCIRIQVTDTGDGIAAEHLPHLFERFYRADAARNRGHGGSGIGLAIVRAIVVDHGGRVAAASDGPGRGATFTITLPGSP
ncbi:HAMP domain-containing sensor histidine kinase [Dactylosporangium sp. NPDC049140]|jgi:signal transduction histidine kinase|uniref:HAMP domain-containing sensor histidine kinase n=1 Tax=Dactylosporangium sp. NPDC049140 TaxID=3155647 RepID=UPI0034072B9C